MKRTGVRGWVWIVILAISSLGWSWPCGTYDWECQQKKEEARQRKETRERFRKACSNFLARECSDKDVDEYRLGVLRRLWR